MKLLRLFTVILAILLLHNVSAQDTGKQDLKSKPQNLDEAIQQLDILFHDTIKHQIHEMTEDDFLANTHFSTGMWIRNNWGLWRGGKLATYFHELEIYHPDDMSSIILRCYYRHLHDKPYNLDEQIKFYHDYWEKVQAHEYRMKNDTAYVRQQELENEKAMQAYCDTLKLQYPSGTKVTAWVDYSDGVFNKGRTQVEGTIVEWKEIKALIEITKFRDEKKEHKVRRYNKMSGNTLWVSVYLMDKPE